MWLYNPPNVKATYYANGNILQIRFELENGEEAIEGRRRNMVRTEMEIRLPSKMNASDIHKDHLALITVLSVNPFVTKQLYMELEVSQEFAERLQIGCTYDLKFASKDGKPYNSTHGRPCLAFSGGVDSTAALMLMPKSTVCVWLDRPDLEKRTLYNKTAARYTMQFSQKNNYETYEIYCDVEHLVSPVGFPVDLASGITAIALASLTNGNSIAYGMVMEAAYRTGHTKFRDYPRSRHYNTWNQAFAAAGIPLFLPVGGISEVGTSKIVLDSKFNGKARSCIRGEWPEQCNNCWKCFRKTMVDNRILSNKVQNDEMKIWMNVREVKYKLSAWPVSHENVLAWALKNPKLEGEIASSLLSRLEGSTRNLELLAKWFPPSIELIPVEFRGEFVKRVGTYIETMSDIEIAESESLDISEWLGSETGLNARAEFDDVLESLAQD